MKKNVKFPVFQIILERLKTHKRIQDEQYIALWKSMVDMISTGNGDYEAEEIQELRGFVVRRCMNQNISDLDGDTAFELGNVWGAMKTLDYAEQIEREPIYLSALADKYKGSIELFRIIDRNPGIMQKDIAAKLGKSPSALSQMLHKLNKEKLFLTIKQGRDKRYFLAERGQELLCLMCETKSVINEKRALNDNYVLELQNTNRIEHRAKREPLEELESRMPDLFEGLGGYALFGDIGETRNVTYNLLNEKGSYDKVFEASWIKNMNDNFNQNIV